MMLNFASTEHPDHQNLVLASTEHPMAEKLILASTDHPDHQNLVQDTTITDVEGYGPPGPLEQDLAPLPGYPGQSQYFQGSYGYGYPIYYPGTYGYGYQYPSYYSGMYAKYVKDSTEKLLARFKLKTNKIFVLFPRLIFSTESSRLIRASTDDF